MSMIVKNKKILIVDDEEPIRNLYTYKFKLGGYNVESAKDGKTGLIVTQNFNPDMILLDLMMPEMNGEEMLEEVRQQEWGKDIKVLILTNIGKDEAPAILRFLNISGYVVKANHTPQQVFDIVEHLLK